MLPSILKNHSYTTKAYIEKYVNDHKEKYTAMNFNVITHYSVKDENKENELMYSFVGIQFDNSDKNLMQYFIIVERYEHIIMKDNIFDIFHECLYIDSNVCGIYNIYTPDQIKDKFKVFCKSTLKNILS